MTIAVAPPGYTSPPSIDTAAANSFPLILNLLKDALSYPPHCRRRQLLSAHPELVEGWPVNPGRIDTAAAME